ncbi:MAG TPA: hypothetical protein VFC18_15105 [Burkholderiales bacterium]|nr:hypothetical protein [Burkholderiales bacterium]
MNARWIRLGTLGREEFDAACERLAQAQAPRARPIVAWAQAEDAYLFAIIAPRRVAPGRPTRWLSWGLAPAVATYRQFGVPATLDGDGDGIGLHGRRVAAATLREIGECVVIGASFLARFPDACLPTPSSELEQAFRLRLSAQHGWEFDHSWPSEPERVPFSSSYRPILS